MHINRTQIIVFAFLIGFIPWIIAPIFSDQRELWDTGGLFVIVLGLSIISSAIAGYLLKARFWLYPLVLFVGQLVGIFILRALSMPAGADFIIAGVVILAIYSLPNFFFAAVGSAVRFSLSESIRKKRSN